MLINHQPTTLGHSSAWPQRHSAGTRKPMGLKPPSPMASNNERCTNKNKVKAHPAEGILSDFFQLFSTKSPTNTEDINPSKPMAVAHEYSEIIADWVGSVCNDIGEYVSDCISYTINAEQGTCAINQTPLNALSCPVKASDGHIYEAHDLRLWVLQCKRQGKPPTSPLTRETLTHVKAVPQFKNLGLLLANDHEQEQIFTINQCLKDEKNHAHRPPLF